MNCRPCQHITAPKTIAIALVIILQPLVVRYMGLAYLNYPGNKHNTAARAPTRAEAVPNLQPQDSCRTPFSLVLHPTLFPPWLPLLSCRLQLSQHCVLRLLPWMISSTGDQ